MLTPRLVARCPSAKPLGVYAAHGWCVDFTKRSSDGSGKASLAPSSADTAWGVLFEIAKAEQGFLDAAEGKGYDRINDFSVSNANDKSTVCATYIANEPEAGLHPYDWYLALIVAGADEHRLDADYRSALKTIQHRLDQRPSCTYRAAALEALKAAGYRDAAHAFGASSNANGPV